MAGTKYDPAAVEAALGFELPTPQLMGWRLVDRESGVELEITGASPVPYPAVTVPAELVDHLEQMVLEAMKNIQDRVAAGQMRDGAFLLGELQSFDLLLGGAPDDLCFMLRNRQRQQLSVVPFAVGSDIVACLCAAKCTLFHYGGSQQRGPAN